MVFHFRRTYKSFIAIFESLNVLEKEKVFRDVIGPKITDIRKKFDPIEKILKLICEALAKQWTRWDGVLVHSV
ncbi:hypothetical protein BC938DRAFT_471707 [Jimgerdemannia flammicorona]|uniref:Uncharacterized protein n=1 Tax=Jimgerdemannia flammicorona TaxID=994334 RepID=A0A433QZY6_9FUNG|nr:hypothetical protein BC938DRAFT_471707 [Jimgerdemannia flammicorona]